jgi:chromosomal replication initiation ATPase DnaA
MATKFPSRVYIRRAAEAFGVREEEITGKRRPNYLVRARWAVMLAMRGGQSACQIGARLNRDHSSVLHGFKHGEELAKRDAWFATQCRVVAEGRQHG